MYKSYDTFSADAEPATVTTAAIIAGNDSRSFFHGATFGNCVFHAPRITFRRSAYSTSAEASPQIAARSGRRIGIAE